MKAFLKNYHLILVLLCINSICAGSAIGSAGDFEKEDLLGLWQMDLVDKGSAITVFLDIQATETDTLKCLLQIPDFGMKNAPYGQFVLTSDSIFLPGFSGRYYAAEKKISAVFFALGPMQEVELHKVSALPEFELNCPEKKADKQFDSGGRIWSKPVIHEGHIYFGNDDGKFTCLNSTDWSVVWQFNCTAEVRSSALVEEGKVVFSSDDGYLYSLDADSGDLIWKAHIGNDEAPRIKLTKDGGGPFDYMCSSPVSNGQYIFIGSLDSSVYAVDKNDGKIQWKYKTNSRVRSTASIAGDTLYVGSWDNHMYALSTDDGSMLWKYDTGKPIQSSPLVVDDIVIFGSRIAWVFGVNRHTGTEVWKTLYWASWVESSPVYYDGLVYIGSSDFQIVQAFDPQTGHVVQSSKVQGWAWANPAVSEQFIFQGAIGSLHAGRKLVGGLYAFDRTTGAPVWQFKYEEDPDIFIYGVGASPTVSDGMVIFGGLDGILYGIQAESIY